MASQGQWFKSYTPALKETILKVFWWSGDSNNIKFKVWCFLWNYYVLEFW